MKRRSKKNVENMNDEEHDLLANKTKVSAKKGIKKQYLKKESVCRVTFRLPKEAISDAHQVMVVGDFNNWSMTETPMKKLKNGDFTATLDLPCPQEYRFRYLVNAERWENDWLADRYTPNAFGSDDSVVVT